MEAGIVPGKITASRSAPARNHFRPHPSTSTRAPRASRFRWVPLSEKPIQALSDAARVGEEHWRAADRQDDKINAASLSKSPLQVAVSSGQAQPILPRNVLCGF